jgi:hypothetical protein
MDPQLLKDALSRLALTATARDEFAKGLTPLERTSAELITEMTALEHRCQHSEWDDLSSIIELAKLTGSPPYLVELLVMRAFSPLDSDLAFKCRILKACFEAPQGLSAYCIRRLLTEVPPNSPLLETVREGFRAHTSRNETMKHVFGTLAAAARDPSSGTMYLLMMPVLAHAILESVPLAIFLVDMPLTREATGPVFRVLRSVIQKEKAEFLMRDIKHGVKFPTELECPLIWHIIMLLEHSQPQRDRRNWLLKLLSAADSSQIIDELVSLAAKSSPEGFTPDSQNSDFGGQRRLPRPRNVD